ncbi:MAG TPA: tRNA pseudouridine(55) synthase TruB [Patescibacteria group bacterium]|nr:tRNA pseudouridine(55) synthase TruB [Patescibacteria group bacterium]
MLKGIVAINKPKGLSSHDIVDQVRKITGERRIGHAGTLDPLASGVLVVAIGRENTKKISSIVKTEKEYLGEIKLGMVSATDDAEGPLEKVEVKKIPTFSEVQKAVNKFIGKIEQKPPIYSAIKIKGKKAYELARKGKNPKLKIREVYIGDIKILNYSWPILKLEITCGPGTYIRSLARDIGDELGVGGYVKELKRTKVGDYKIKNSLDLQKLN